MGKIRKSVIAGSWYPGDSSVLRDDITKYIQNVPQRELEGNIAALIVPHAGYVYSGQVAAYAYKLLLGKRYDS
ncbi:MAG: AmmeMemoRadiSam system protein B, partial [Deltaproteobacteria bacterium HGW-Deltaproteobacteria-1]